MVLSEISPQVKSVRSDQSGQANALRSRCLRKWAGGLVVGDREVSAGQISQVSQVRRIIVGTSPQVSRQGSGVVRDVSAKSVDQVSGVRSGIKSGRPKQAVRSSSR